MTDISDMESFDLNNYVETRMIKINDRNCLIDDHGIIFSDDRTNTVIGRRKHAVPLDSITTVKYEWF